MAGALLVLAACGGSEGGGGDTAGATAPPDPVAGPPVPTDEVRRLQVDGLDRSYRLVTPRSAQEGRAPLVLALHGGGNTAQSLAGTTMLDQAADRHGLIVAYPEAWERGVWNGGFCCTGGRGSAAADLHFLDRVVTDVADARDVDLDRVYAVGVSAGGVMAYRLGCDLAGKVAGVGSVAGVMKLDDCNPAVPVSVIEIHGTADEIVPYEGGVVISERVATELAPPTRAVAERWAALNRCPGPVATEVEGTVTTARWAGCAGGTEVRLVTLEGGTHNWFAPEFGPPDGAVDATAELLAFFGLDRPR